MSIATDNLIHFLGRESKKSPSKQIEIFKAILENGLLTGEVTIKFGDTGAIFNQIICFTDIPLRECDEHTAIYGKFGIGFRKLFVKHSGGNPARYFVDYMPGETIDSNLVESRGQLFLNLCQNFKVMYRLEEYKRQNGSFCLLNSNGDVILNQDDVEKLIESQIFAFSYDKEIGDIGPARDETKEMDLYYREREWRIVPSAFYLISSTVDHVDGRYLYKSNHTDVNVILVPNQDCRDIIMGYLQGLSTHYDERLKQFSSSHIPVNCYDDLHLW